MPRNATFGAAALNVDTAAFTFTTSSTSDILQTAFDRYRVIIFGSPAAGFSPASTAGGVVLTSLAVDVASTDETLQLGVDESYTLSISATSSGQLQCQTVFGCLRGLETFSQLVVRTASASLPTYIVTGVPLTIHDWPRFPHRGLLLDTSRHYQPLPLLYAAIDALAYDKANTLHWHLTDEQAFPFASQAVPELVQGAWAPAAVYTPSDMRALVQYALYRGVRIVPEVDTPAHSLSWGVGRPDILLPCPSNPYDSVLDPTTNATYEAIYALYAELAGIFSDGVFHAGMDEVDVTNTSCYNTPKVVAWMQGQGMAAGDWKAVARYHMSRVQDIVVSQLNRTMGVWEEAVDHYGPGTVNPTPPPPELRTDTTIVDMWFCPCWQWWNMSAIVDYGFRGVKQDDWYLDDPSNAWDAMYGADPLTNARCSYAAGWANCTCSTPSGCFNITEPGAVSRVLGGEASLWAEHIDGTNLMTSVWPRMSAVAERLWSSVEVNDPVAAAARLDDHRCRMRARGIDVAPFQPGWCDGSRA